MTRAYATTNHERIKKWVEERGAHPAGVTDASKGGVLRIDFNPSDEQVDDAEWDTFLDAFDKRLLAFLYQDEAEKSAPSHFSKFIDRRSTEANDLEQGPEEEVEKEQSTK